MKGRAHNLVKRFYPLFVKWKKKGEFFRNETIAIGVRWQLRSEERGGVRRTTDMFLYFFIVYIQDGSEGRFVFLRPSSWNPYNLLGIYIVYFTGVLWRSRYKSRLSAYCCHQIYIHIKTFIIAGFSWRNSILLYICCRCTTNVSSCIFKLRRRITIRFISSGFLRTFSTIFLFSCFFFLVGNIHRVNVIYTIWSENHFPLEATGKSSVYILLDHLFHINVFSYCFDRYFLARFFFLYFLFFNRNYNFWTVIFLSTNSHLFVKNTKRKFQLWKFLKCDFSFQKYLWFRNINNGIFYQKKQKGYFNF